MQGSEVEVVSASGHLLSLIDFDQVTVAFIKVSTGREICYKGRLQNYRCQRP